MPFNVDTLYLNTFQYLSMLKSLHPSSFDSRLALAINITIRQMIKSSVVAKILS